MTKTRWAPVCVFLWMLAALAALATSRLSPRPQPLSQVFPLQLLVDCCFFAAVTVAAATVAIAVIIASVTAPSPLLSPMPSSLLLQTSKPLLPPLTPLPKPLSPLFSLRLLVDCCFFRHCCCRRRHCRYCCHCHRCHHRHCHCCHCRSCRHCHCCHPY